MMNNLTEHVNTILALAQAHRKETTRQSYATLAAAVRLVVAERDAMRAEAARLCTALESAQKDAERIAFLRWSKEIVIAKLDDCGVLRKSSIPTLDAAIKAQGEEA